MKETTPAAIPPCFNRWCQRFDDVFTRQAQRREFRNYLAGLLGESERKNIFQMSTNAVGVIYHKLHHFLTEAPWSAEAINERRLQVMNQCRQTKLSSGFTLIVDDSGHRKSGTLTDGVGRQYIGEIGKTDNGIVMVTTHFYDGVKSLPLDVELYQHATSLAGGKLDPEFVKKPDLALSLIERCLKRAHKPRIVLIDSSHGNNSQFVQQLESKKLNYIVGLAKNRRVFLQEPSAESKVKMRLDEVAKSLKPEVFTELTLQSEKPRTVWATTFSGETIGLEGKRVFAIVMNTPTLTDKTEIDYFMTNASGAVATAQ